MTVVEGWFAGTRYKQPPRKEQLPPSVVEDIIKNICTNSKAWYKEEPGALPVPLCYTVPASGWMYCVLWSNHAVVARVRPCQASMH